MYNWHSDDRFYRHTNSYFNDIIFKRIGTTAWKTLEKHLRNEDTLLRERITASNLKKQCAKGLSMIAKGPHKNIIAHSTLWETSKPLLYELGSIWTHPSFRFMGLASYMFRNLDLVPAFKGGGIPRTFLITGNPRIKRLVIPYPYISGWTKLNDKGCEQILNATENNKENAILRLSRMNDYKEDMFVFPSTPIWWKDILQLKECESIPKPSDYEDEDE